MAMRTALTLLLIDDSPEDRHTYKAFLRENQDCNYTFLEADDADEGLRLCQQASVDCILLDYQLPDLNGIDFLERLRDDAGHRTTPVIMLTGRGSEQVAVEALKKGATDYLVKSSVTPESLFRATHTALEISELHSRIAQEKAERELAEQELRDSESRFRMLVESVKDYAILMLDTEGRVTSWNAGARGLFGYHDREILTQHFRRLFTAEDARARLPERELQEASAEQRFSADRWYQRKDGTRFWASGSVFPVLDRAGTLRGYSKVLRDITERWRTQLRLEEALTARDEFLSVASHELKTPVTSVLLQIQGLLRQLKRRKDDPLSPERLIEPLERSSEQLERLGALIGSLLDVSKITSKRLVLDPQPVELSALVRQVLETQTEQLALSGNTVSLEVQAAVTGLWDRARLEQVLVNLLSNAAKYAPGRPIEVRVGNSATRAFVRVKDHGPGVPKQDQERIFRRFERASQASEVSGLGLGLYIARHILEAFGGTLRVESEAGHGATFILELPIGEHRDSAGSVQGV